MGLFKEIYCAECGAKTKLLFRHKLGDDNYICNNCCSEFPGYIKNCFNDYNLEMYKDTKEYIAHSNNELSKIFNETNNFHGIHLDNHHNLFYFEEGLFAKPLYLKLEHLDDFKLTYSPDTFKEGTFGDKVTGKILFKIKMSYPCFFHEKIIASDIKAKAKTKFFGSEIIYDNPKGMDDFLLYFLTAWNDVISAQIDSECDEPTSDMSPLQQAMALFMLDTLDDVSPDDLKKQRNRLMQTFHPDTGSSSDNKYAQKINNAYEILKNQLS